MLEGAGLVVTEKVGRAKLHYLNPVPIQEIQQRWISKYAETDRGRPRRAASAERRRTTTA